MILKTALDVCEWARDEHPDFKLKLIETPHPNEPFKSEITEIKRIFPTGWIWRVKNRNSKIKKEKT